MKIIVVGKNTYAVSGGSAKDILQNYPRVRGLKLKEDPEARGKRSWELNGLDITEQVAMTILHKQGLEYRGVVNTARAALELQSSVKGEGGCCMSKKAKVKEVKAKKK